MKTEYILLGAIGAVIAYQLFKGKKPTAKTLIASMEPAVSPVVTASPDISKIVKALPMLTPVVEPVIINDDSLIEPILAMPQPVVTSPVIQQQPEPVPTKTTAIYSSEPVLTTTRTTYTTLAPKYSLKVMTPELNLAGAGRYWIF